MRSKYAARVRSCPSPQQGHRTPYCPWVVWNLGGRARPRNLFARFPPCFKNTSRGALRLSSKAVPVKEADGREAAAQGKRSEAQRLPYARSGTQMGNKGRTKNVRIYGEHGVCNTLCLFMYPLLSGHTGFVSLFIQNKRP